LAGEKNKSHFKKRSEPLDYAEPNPKPARRGYEKRSSLTEERKSARTGESRARE
jgi:hypothetical protein